jgi:hypothetical protein
MSPWGKVFLEALIDGFLVPLLILMVSLLRSEPRRRWLDVTTVIGSTVYVALGSQIMPRGIRHTYDTIFLRADALLGFDPLAFADRTSHHWVLMVVLLLTYGALPVMIGLAWVLEQDLVMRRAVLLGGCVCFAFYALFPAVGPRHFDWVNHAPKPAPDNCMPSMHLTWALLIAINARSAWLRIGLWVYVVLIAAATLALQEHYLVDLIAAVPYTIAVQWMGRHWEDYRSVFRNERARLIAAPFEPGQPQP